jgi:REP-associated tyrosine transposase
VWDRVFDPVGRPEGPQAFPLNKDGQPRSFRPHGRVEDPAPHSQCSLMQPKYQYRRRLPHIQKDNRPVFVTFTTDHRWILAPIARDAVLESCLQPNGDKFDLHAAVIMPDHVHLIFTCLRRSDGWIFSLPEIIHAVKGASARKINVLLGRRGPVWQEEFFDHVLRSNDSLAEKVDYVCQNPVRSGWLKKRISIHGCGEGSSLSSESCGLSGRLTGPLRPRSGQAPTRSHTSIQTPAVTSRTVSSVI